jgi:hypothetical protein
MDKDLRQRLTTIAPLLAMLETSRRESEPRHDIRQREERKPHDHFDSGSRIHD